MKKIIFSAMALFALASCAKQESPAPASGEGDAVNITFVPQENTLRSRAFFDPSATTESWEKTLNAITVLVFDQGGGLIVQRNFTASEVAGKKATFSLPRSAAGTSCEFYAVANRAVTGISNKTGLLALIESSADEYNGTFTKDSTEAGRSGGFVMSGSATKTVAAAGTSTDVTISLKRAVAKIAVQSSLSEEFSQKYPGKIRINSTAISRAASQTPLIAPQEAVPGTMDYTFTQTPGQEADKYNNLFYLFENGPLDAGSRVLLTLEGTYDRDGDFGTEDDQQEVTYEVELDGAGNNGQINRNGYYRLAVTLNGLTGADINASITVEDWAVPVTQEIILGQ